VKHVFFVSFEREVREDRTIARKNFPDFEGDRQLKAQFRAELDQNRGLRGTYSVESVVIDGNDERYEVRFVYDHPSDDYRRAREAFRAELQKTYDRWHMAGFFHIKGLRKIGARPDRVL
jgi:hypothetical protein